MNLSPAHIRKIGTRFDLPIAASLLTAMGIIPPEHTGGILIAGEVGLNGKVRPVNGILQTVMLARDQGCTWCLVPEENAREGAAVPEVAVTGVGTLKELLEYLILSGKGQKTGTVCSGLERRRKNISGGFQGDKRSGRSKTGSSDRGGRHAQPADDRKPGSGENHDRQTYAYDPSRSYHAGKSGDYPGIQRMRPCWKKKDW